MPRENREVQLGQPHHITHRGHNRDKVFTDREDCEYKLWLLHQSSASTACQIHAYVLMGNHFHAIITPTVEHGLAKMMQWAGSSYSRYFNRRFGRTGTAWGQRFASFVIDSERYFLACSRYIEMNPVRASIVNAPGDHEWSSFHHNALGTSDRLITPHQLYDALGSDDAERRKEYASLFASHLDPDVVKKIQRGFRTERSKQSAEEKSD